MYVVLGIAIVAWLLTFIDYGFGIVSILVTITTGMFCCRKFGYFCKPTTLVVIEGIGIFLSTMLKMLFKSFVLSRFIILILLRLIFFAVVAYDVKTFIYVKEVHRKEN
jgi:hypothetical protein